MFERDDNKGCEQINGTLSILRIPLFSLVIYSL